MAVTAPFSAASALVGVALPLLLAAPVLLAAGCGGPAAPPVPPDPYYGEAPPSVPPLRGEGFPFGRPPAPEVAVGGRPARGLLAAWTWPRDPNRIEMAEVGWPPRLGDAALVSTGDRVRLRVPGVTFRPSSFEMAVVARSYYAGAAAPRGPAELVLERTFDVGREVSVTRDGVSVEWAVYGLVRGEWVLVFHPRWDAPIGGDALYLVPVRVR